MSRRFEGKVVVVTGAADGLGRALALGYAGEGGELVLLDIEPEGMAQTAEMIHALGVPCSTHQIDLANEGDIIALGERLCAVHPAIHVLYNNAGIAYGAIQQAIETVTMPQFLQFFAVNTVAPLLLAKALRPALAAGKGAVINQTSVGAAMPGGAYGVTKSALNQMTFCMANLFGPDGIRVNAIAPGMMETPASVANVHPKAYEAVQKGQMLKLHGEAEDIVRLGLFLASDEARFITAEVMHCDAGARIRGWRY
jgi:NAD(P)-dependent dehydrogenase (short-subunit alcohol dehydrogenase family)